MAQSVIDPEQFLSEGVFREEAFLEKAKNYDWQQFRNKQVLVRGCSSAIIPPWAFMFLTGKLAGLAKTIRYGNEHDNVVVYRSGNNNKDVNQSGGALEK